MEYYSSTYKGVKYWHMLQHGEPWKQYAKWKKSGRTTDYKSPLTWSAQNRQVHRDKADARR